MPKNKWKNKIRACPFCASKNATFMNVAQDYIECDDCGAYGPSADSPLEAIRLWNKRPITRRPENA